MMNAGDIAFPHLGIYLENVPRSFTVFGFEIAFYGLIIGIGVLAGERRESGYYLGLRYLCRDLFRDRCQNLLCDLCLGLLQG